MSRRLCSSTLIPLSCLLVLLASACLADKEEGGIDGVFGYQSSSRNGVSLLPPGHEHWLIWHASVILPASNLESFQYMIKWHSYGHVNNTWHIPNEQQHTPGFGQLKSFICKVVWPEQELIAARDAGSIATVAALHQG